MAGGKGTRETASRYPNVDGITSATTTQKGHTMNLMWRESNVPKRLKAGID